MTIRGGGNPHTAMATMPMGEWTRRFGALPAEAYDCFMVETLCGFNRIQAWFARRSLAANGRLPSDRCAADHPIAGSLPPCSRWSRTSLRRVTINGFCVERSPATNREFRKCANQISKFTE